MMGSSVISAKGCAMLLWVSRLLKAGVSGVSVLSVLQHSSTYVN
jgi:hypothetical protein